MIICSCNVLTDNDVRNAVIDAADERAWSPSKVYGCLGCSVECGRCVKTVRKIMNDTLLACGRSSCEGCPMLTGDTFVAAFPSIAIA
jgi:bacterioferritin-associated ferredoxin